MTSKREEIKKCPICKKDLIAVEYSWDTPDHYDGISEYVCDELDNSGNFHYRVGRWTGEILEEGETEPPYGERRDTNHDK